MKVYKSVMCRLLPVLLAVIVAAGCGHFSDSAQPGQAEAGETAGRDPAAGAKESEGRDTAAGENKTASDTAAGMPESEEAETETSDTETDDSEPAAAADLPVPGSPEAFSLSMVPEYSGSIWADINEDVPFFDEKEMEAARRLTKILSSQQNKDSVEKPEQQANREPEEQEDPESAGQESSDLQRVGSFKTYQVTYQVYGDLDSLGRCTGACALVGPETLPQEERGQIGMIKPTGWHTVKYEGIDGSYLYNRCHLIGFQLTGQDANEKNLITGTRAMNVEGMLPYEDSVLAYVRGTGRHVLYRVTPVFRQDNLLADGVLMEACSVEDPLVRFCAFCYNVQPGIQIDYTTGESKVTERSPQGIPEKQAVREWKYIVNVSSRKFHRPDCESVQKMSQKNRQGFSGSREELIEMGYEPCGNCNP